MSKKFIFVNTDGDYEESVGAYEEVDFINVSTGAADAGKPIVLDAEGQIDASMIDDSDIDHGSIGGLLDDDHTQYILVDGTRAFTGDQSMGGNKITGLAQGTAGTDAVNVDQLTANLHNFDWKGSVRALSDSNVDIATGGLLTVDGITLVAGDRVLLTGQTDASENGIYVAASGAWTRALDADQDSEVTAAMTVPVGGEGTTYANQTWRLVSADDLVVGTDDLDFQVMPINTFTGGAGIELSGNKFSADLLASGGIKFVGVGDAGELAIEPNDFAGTGLVGDGSDNLAIDFSTTFDDLKAVSAQDLASNNNGEGASIIGIEDSAGYFTATDVEGALSELGQSIVEVGSFYTVGTGGVSAGDLVYVDSNDTVLPLDIANKDFGIGLALETKLATETVKVLANDTVVSGVLTGATAGTKYYWDGTDLVTGIPATAGDYVWLVGVAKNATDLHVNVEFIKRNSL